METKSLVTYQVIFKDVICTKFHRLLENGTLKVVQTRLALAVDFRLLAFFSRSTAADSNKKDY